MGLFHRKKAAVKNLEDRELVESNARSIEALVVLAESNEEVIGDFRALQEKIKYLIPSEDHKIYDFDKKIKNLIEDLRIALVKEDGEFGKKAKNIMVEIKLAIADRNTKL